jgi:two-component system, OmpR family, sensor histidine kinase KdpD
MSDDSADKRPDPDALLEQAKKEGQGRLKIFLGAAPGVGKTYEMLTQARQRRLEGVDVLIGVVETHGRVETDLLTKGLQALPKKRVLYRGHVLAEMDIDAILQRRPKLVLVDELAHTNVEGSRHPKRYMDVEELLEAGIDVYTTFNIQHLESLKDVVAKITHVQVHETVPDSIIDRADEVEVIDVTPEDLIQRLKEGKVYIPEQAERAIRHYFTQGNLTALRELALRRTAQRVDEQMLSYMQSHAIAGPWETSDRVLACIGEDRSSAALVRYAKRLADRLRAPWTAIHIETPRARELKETDRNYIAECQRLAEKLGGASVTIPAADPADGIVDYAQANNFTHVVIARSRRPNWWEIFVGSTPQRLIRHARGINVHVMADRTEPEHVPSHSEAAASRPANRGSFDAKEYLGSLGMVVGALLLALVLRQFLGISNIALVFLTSVLASAVTYGLGPALFACFVSVLAFNFFFLPPLYTFTIADPENVVALFSFAIVAVIASNLTARVRAQAVSAQRRAKMTEDLYLFSRKLGGVVTLDDLLWATAYQIASMLQLRVVLLLPEGESVAVRSGYPPEDMLSDADIAAAKWCWQNDRPAGRGADTLPGAKRLFIPIHTGRGAVGVVGLDNDKTGPLLTPDQRRLLDALTDQAALAIERINLAADVDKAMLAAETEKLRTALLTSISHDLRTPLASILGSATTLRIYRTTMADAAQEDLLRTIQEESERLNRFIGNLLDMTRLETGAIAPKTDLVDLSDIIGSALKRAAQVVSLHHVKLEIATDLPMLPLDPVLFEQVLFNLLDNARKYASPGTEIRLRAWKDGDLVRIAVLDEGEGIPAQDIERIFDKFYRVHAADRKPAGTGLGLAICRGFVEAMGGTIVAGNRSDRRGAVFTITFRVPFDEPAVREKTA